MIKRGRVIAVWLIAVMAVALVTACGGGGGGTTSTAPSLAPVAASLMGGAIQQQPSLTNTVSTYAGGGVATGSLDGMGNGARFSNPNGITSDGANLYVVDTTNQTIRKTVIATGAVTTLAGSAGVTGNADGAGSAAQFSSPMGVATDGANLYVTDTNNCTIRKVVLATGGTSTLAGLPGGCGSADGTATAARFNYPTSIVIDASRANLYVMDISSGWLRKVVIATGDVTSIAGVGGGISGDMVTDGFNLYMANSGNSILQVVIATGAVTTLAGGNWGSADGTGAAASFNSPTSVATDGTNLYVTDRGNATIRQVVIATGAVTTIAGLPGNAGATDGVWTNARFNAPTGITMAGGSLYVTEAGNNAIRQVATPTGSATVSTLAGGGAAVSFNLPQGVATDGANLYVADSSNHSIRKIAIATGVVTTLAGSGTPGSANGAGTAAQFNNPVGVTTDGVNLYVTDWGNHSIRKVVIATGAVTNLAGNPGVAGSFDGTGSNAEFNGPNRLTTDGVNVYVADTNNHTLRKVVIATGAVTTIAGTAGTPGSTDGSGASALFNTPTDITTDGANLFIADSANNTVRKVVIATGAVTTLAGAAGTAGLVDGTGAAALFNNPGCITTDGVNLYVSEWNNHTIRKVVIASGAVTTLAGNGGWGLANGTGTAAAFNRPTGITTDGVSLYVADTYNNVIRKIQ